MSIWESSLSVALGVFLGVLFILVALVLLWMLSMVILLFVVRLNYKRTVRRNKKENQRRAETLAKQRSTIFEMFGLPLPDGPSGEINIPMVDLLRLTVDQERDYKTAVEKRIKDLNADWWVLDAPLDGSFQIKWRPHQIGDTIDAPKLDS